ncbi:MAG: hypothetical protein CMJ49_10780 [Planctomycetaceae bacterium]|nr:hypothetical protein [Planctomycetaceae bacterium]
MIWHPQFSSTFTTLLVFAALAVMSVGYYVSRRQLNVNTLPGLLSILLRIVAFFVLLFMLLQPTRLPKPRIMKLNRSVALLIDTSASMAEPATAAAPDRSRLDRGLEAFADHHVIQRISDTADLNVYRFDSQLTPIQTTSLSKLSPDGRQTDLTAALQNTIELNQPHDLAAILLISDGTHNHGPNPQQPSAAIDIPIYALGVGEIQIADDRAHAIAPNIAVESATAEPRIILGRSVPILSSITANRAAAGQIRVELIAPDGSINASAVALSPQHPRRQAMFTVKPTQLGTHVYQVHAPPIDGETNTADNTRSVTIEVVDPVHRLLYLDRLRFERSYLKRVIHQLPNVRYTSIVPQAAGRTLVQGNDPQSRQSNQLLSDSQLLGLKVIIIGDLPANQLTDTQIDALADWVDRGGSLMLLAGPDSLGPDGFAHSPLGPLLPVDLNTAPRYIESQFNVDLTPEGAAHPAFQKIRQRWGAAPALLSRFDTGPVKPAATTLFTSTDARNAPIIISRRHGHGKVALVLTDSTWRWQLAFDPDHDQSQSPHHVFWAQMIDWLMPQLQTDTDAAQQVQLIANPVTCEVSDSVYLTVSVRGPDGSVIRDAKVDLLITPPDGREIRRAAELDQNDNPDLTAYTASFQTHIAGRHTVTATARRAGQTLGSDQVNINVTQRAIEQFDTQPNHPLLRELAAATGGAFLTPADLERLELLGLLEPREVKVQPNAATDAIPVWNRWWILAIFVALMAGEWLVRRMNQWV